MKRIDTTPMSRANNDCTVIALSILLDIPYLEAEKIMILHGRAASGRWTGGAEMFRLRLSRILSGALIKRSGTVGKFVKDHPKGKYLVWVNRHVFAVIGGTIYDHIDKPRRRVLFAWSVGTR